MYGQKNIKLYNAEQAKGAYQYKNIKLNLYKNNAAVWYNKICSSLLSTRVLYGCLQRVTIPEAVVIQMVLLMMSSVLLETC